MKRFLLLALGTGLGLGIVLAVERGHAQLPAGPGPGPQGAVLKQSWEMTAPPGASAPAANPNATYVQGLFNQSAATQANPSPTGPLAPSPALAGLSPGGQTTLPPWQERPDLNRDIAVTPSHGPWMIYIESYTGPEAPVMARQMVSELRSTYRLHAYVYNHGAEERRKEYERVRDIVHKQQEWIKERGGLATPIRVRHIRVEEQCAVLVGGFKTEDDARSALVKIRNLPPPDPRKVRLATGFQGKESDREQLNDGQQGFLNPFKRAFVGRNPTVKTERPADWDKLDLAVLKKLNRDEPFSLLKCPKPVTLVIKQLNTPAITQPKSASGKFLDVIGLSGKERRDAAGESAHNLAEVLRKMKVDAYVLHTRFASIVTVGGFDSTHDPALHSMQHFIETRLVPNMGQVGLLPRPMPWEYRAAFVGS